MSGSAIPEDDLPTMEYEASQACLRAVQKLAEVHGTEAGMRPGRVVRYVIVAESLVGDDNRRVDMFAKGPDGSGLYQWETLGLMEFAKERLREDLGI